MPSDADLFLEWHCKNRHFTDQVGEAAQQFWLDCLNNPPSKWIPEKSKAKNPEMFRAFHFEFLTFPPCLSSQTEHTTSTQFYVTCWHTNAAKLRESSILNSPQSCYFLVIRNHQCLMSPPHPSMQEKCLAFVFRMLFEKANFAKDNSRRITFPCSVILNASLIIGIMFVNEHFKGGMHFP